MYDTTIYKLAKSRNVIHNKYLKWYIDIVLNATKENRFKANEMYYEKHHILPKSYWPDHNKDKNNTVLLTAREHFLCHRLLTKCTKDVLYYKMLSAFWRMLNFQGGNKEKPIFSSKIYESTRILFSDYRKNVFRHTKESAKKCSRPGKLNGMYGRKRTKEEKEIFIKSNSQGIFHTPWGDYLTANQASIHAPFKVSSAKILDWCKNNTTERLCQIVKGFSKIHNISKNDKYTTKQFGYDFTSQLADRWL